MTPPSPTRTRPSPMADRIDLPPNWGVVEPSEDAKAFAAFLSSRDITDIADVMYQSASRIRQAAERPWVITTQRNSSLDDAAWLEARASEIQAMARAIGK